MISSVVVAFAGATAPAVIMNSPATRPEASRCSPVISFLPSSLARLLLVRLRTRAASVASRSGAGGRGGRRLPRPLGRKKAPVDAIHQRPVAQVGDADL